MPTLQDSFYIENDINEETLPLKIKEKEAVYPNYDLLQNEYLSSFAKNRDSVFIPLHFGPFFDDFIVFQADNVFSESTSAMHFQGYAGTERPYSLKMSDGIISFMFISFFLLLFVFSRGFGYIKQMLYNLIENSQRDSIFVESTTSNEYRYKFFMFLQTAISLAVFIFIMIRIPSGHASPKIPELEIITHISLYALIILIFWGAKWLINKFIGYVFFDRESMNNWQNNYFSIIALFSFVFFPIILYLINAQDAVFLNITKNIFLISLAIVFFVISRKGIRFFLVKPHGFFYFILYLCALEMIPYMGLYMGLVYIYNFV